TLTQAFSEISEIVGATGFEPATSWSRTYEVNAANDEGKGLTEAAAPVCTSVCTSEAEMMHSGAAGEASPIGEAATGAHALPALAEATTKLSATDRARLVQLLANVAPEP